MSKGRSGRGRRFVLGLVTIVVAGLLAWWASAELAARNDARQARRSLDEGRLADADAALGRWERARPRSAEMHYLRARLAWARGDLPALQTELARAQTLGYPATAMAGLRGLLLARTGQTAQAEPLLQQAVGQGGRVDPDVAEALARIYLGAYRLARAAEVLDRWSRDWPDDARPCFLRTEVDTRNRAADDVVLVNLLAALERDPNLHQARLRLADLLRAIHRNAEAKEQYATYLEGRTDDPLGHLGAGQNAIEMGDLPEAVRHLDRALELSPRDPVILGARATLAARQGDVETARRYLDRAVEADPFDYGNRYQRMLLLLRLGKRAEADAERQVLEQVRKDQEQFTELSRQLERNPQDPALRSKAATWLMGHGHEDEAADWARLVLQANPADPAMNRLLAGYYRKAGNIGLANFHEAHASPLREGPRPGP